MNISVFNPRNWLPSSKSHDGGGFGWSIWAAARELLLGGKNTIAGVSVTHENAMRCATVLACVRVLAESVASLPLHVYRTLPNGDVVRAITNGREDRIYTVLKSRPNSFQTKFQFFELMMLCLLLRGNFYAHIIRNGEGRIQEIIPIHPNLVTCHRRNLYDMVYEIQVSGGTVVLNRSEILHVAGMGDGVCGHSLIDWARQSIGYALAAEEHGARMFSNGARVGGVLKHPKQISGEAAARLKESFEKAQSGIENAHKTLVLEEGMEWEPIGMNNADAQYLDLRKFQRTEICAIFRVPPHMVQDLERATFTNIEHQSLQFVRDALSPWLIRIEQAMMRDLLTEEEKSYYTIEHNLEGLLRGDTAARYSSYAIALTNGWMSVNEVRKLEGKQPIAGGDVYRVPMHMGAIGAGGKPLVDESQKAILEKIEKLIDLQESERRLKINELIESQ